MTKSRDLDVLLSAYLADGMTALPDRVVEAVLGEAHRTRQRTMFGRWPTRSIFRAAIGGAAAVVLLVVGGFLILQRDKLGVAAPSSTPQATASPTQPAVVAATPRPTAVSDATPLPSVESSGLDLTWTKVDLDVNDLKSGHGSVAWLRDRFVLRGDNGVIRTSLDGATWTLLQPGELDPGHADLPWWASVVTWEDTSVGWWNPEDEPGPEFAGAPPITARDIVRIVRPAASPVDTSPFKGRIGSLAIGPNGIVAQVHSDLDWDDWVRRKLGARTNNEWVTHVKSVDFRDGILDIEMDNGPGLHVVWADEGLEPGDYQDRGFGWYSPDGVDWTEMAPNDQPTGDFGSLLPTGSFGSVVGVSDGFIASGAYPDGTCADPIGSCTGMWYSSDGLTWRILATATQIDPSQRSLCIRDTCGNLPGELLPWRGGALAIDSDGRIDFWTSAGSAKLPMTAQQVHGIDATGPLGLVSIGDGKILVTRDGVDWKIEPIPPAMVTHGDGPARRPTIAVGDRSVLYLTWSGYFGEGDGYVPSLWVGSFEP